MYVHMHLITRQSMHVYVRTYTYVYVVCVATMFITWYAYGEIISFQTCLKPRSYKKT